MPPLQAALLVIGLLALVGGPLLYWIFFKMDNDSLPESVLDQNELPSSLLASDIKQIEARLGITLPLAYSNFLKARHNHPLIDDTTIMCDINSIVEDTLMWRHERNSWPNRWLCIGDEADACPYALDCENGRLIRTDKGNPTAPPLDEYENFEAFLREYQKSIQEDER